MCFKKLVIVFCLGLSPALLFSSNGSSPVLSLYDVIDATRNHNPDARMARHRVVWSQARLDEARALSWPKLGLQSTLSQTDNPASALMANLNQQKLDPASNLNHPGDTENLNVAGVFSMPIYAGGALRAERNLARFKNNASLHDQESVLRDLVLQAILNFNEIMKNKAFVDTAKAASEAFRQNLEVAHKRIEAGTLLPAERLDIEARLAESIETEIIAANNLQRSKETLAYLMGREDTIFNLLPHSWPDDLERPVESSAKRHELQSAQLQTRAAEEALKASKAALKPSIGAFVRTDHNQGWHSDSSDLSYTTGLNLSWDIWDRSLRKSRIRQSAAQLETSRDQERKTELQIRLEQRQAALDFESAKQRLIAAQASLKATTASVELTRARFQQGRSLAIQLIDSESAWTRAQFRVTEAEFNLISNSIRLKHAMGIELIPEPGTPHFSTSKK